jgi:glycosyltransferase involved in cell wall biosynthesis
VGDCCTDDTEQVVESVGDPRVTFVNLPVNSGEQAAPNNRGVAMARGRYVAFLNQDDLYFPDHLSRAVEELERSGADIVWVPCASILPATRRRAVGGLLGSGAVGRSADPPQRQWLLAARLLLRFVVGAPA